MTIGKSKRFEIFKRDSFACQYCGRRPPDVILEVDHIDPRCAGGSDDEINLVTSCFDCNRGKGGKSLGAARPRPDADMEFLRAQQELAEANRYLSASRKVDKARAKIVSRLNEVWLECVSSEFGPTATQWKQWLMIHDPDRVEYAIRQTGPRFQSGSFGLGQNAVERAIKYASGILWRVAERQAGAVQ